MYLGCINWEAIFEGNNVGECYRMFLDKYMESCERFIPNINADSKRRVRPPWLSKELRSMMRLKNDKWRKFVSGGRRCVKLNEEYKEQCRLESMNRNIAEYEINLAKNY